MADGWTLLVILVGLMALVALAGLAGWRLAERRRRVDTDPEWVTRERESIRSMEPVLGPRWVQRELGKLDRELSCGGGEGASPS